MSMSDLVSIVVPVYNGEKFLRGSIESILNQTYTNLEIICVCAGCTDTSTEILREYANSDTRMILHIEQENHGPAYSRNIGMKMAQGEWIIFLDCDDLFEPNLIEAMLQQAVRLQADICCCFWDGFDEQSFGKVYVTNERLKRDCNTYPEINVAEERRHLFQLIEYNAWTKLVHKSIYKKNEVDFGCFPNCEDFYFSLMVSMEAKKIVYIDKVLVHYRINTNRDTQTTMMNKKKNYVWEVLDAVFQYINTKKDNCELRESFYNCVCKNIFSFSRNLVGYVVFNELRDIYLEKWDMLQSELPKRLSYFNQEVYDKVLHGDRTMDSSEMVMRAKVHFVSDMTGRGECAIWGCGCQGQILLERLNNAGVKVQRIFDSDSNKWGRDMFGQVVEQYQENDVDCIIVTSSKYYEEIKEQSGNCAGQVYDLDNEIFRC